MHCPSCTCEMHLTRATSFGDDYWYCRDCKKELAELLPTEPNLCAAVAKPLPNPIAGMLDVLEDLLHKERVLKIPNTAASGLQATQYMLETGVYRFPTTGTYEISGFFLHNCDGPLTTFTYEKKGGK